MGFYDDTYMEDSDTYLYKEAYRKGKEEIVNSIIEILSDLEKCCISHEEGDCGEWTTFTFNYNTWKSVLEGLSLLKSHEDYKERIIKSEEFYKKLETEYLGKVK